MFADDTLVYLREEDDLKVLMVVLSLFCYVSNAWFNDKKYEALPVGAPEYRKRLCETWMLNSKQGNCLKEEVKIVGDGEALRTLGAWVGHSIDLTRNWDAIIDQQVSIMDRWAKMNVSLKGKELVLKSLVASHAFFLATVNGILTKVIKAMHKNMSQFLWDGKQGSLNWKEATMPRCKGGLGVPDLFARRDSITIKWIQQWMSEPSICPVWAYVVDEIMAANVASKPMVEQRSRLDWALQSWQDTAWEMTSCLSLLGRWQIQPASTTWAWMC